jgi:NAD(P)-dependent dehydrogenase (short-subunit alcohol dehydrogenase family)
MSTVLITGANRGLGLEFCRQYALSGWKVLACCRRPGSAQDLERLAAQQAGIQIYSLDVTDHSRIDRLAAELAGEDIDVLLNNAGVYGDSRPNKFGSIDYDRWLDVFRINTMAPVKMAEAFLPHVARSRRKLIVAITSLMGSMADNTSGDSILYRSSKAALNAAMKSLSIDLKGRGVGVLILHPGWVQTDMGGSNAPTSPNESIAGMRRMIEEFSLKNSGRFLDFRGREQPW